MHSATDHTKEVEQRVVAIPIKATDTCGFFKIRDGSAAPICECWYCSYGSFKQDTDNPHEQGFCKFRK